MGLEPTEGLVVAFLEARNRPLDLLESGLGGDDCPLYLRTCFRAGRAVAPELRLFQPKRDGLPSLLQDENPVLDETLALAYGSLEP